MQKSKMSAIWFGKVCSVLDGFHCLSEFMSRKLFISALTENLQGWSLQLVENSQITVSHLIGREMACPSITWVPCTCLTMLNLTHVQNHLGFSFPRRVRDTVSICVWVFCFLSSQTEVCNSIRRTLWYACGYFTSVLPQYHIFARIFLIGKNLSVLELI